MPAVRQAKIDRLRAPESKRLSLGAGALLLFALRTAGICIPPAALKETPLGKPYLSGHPWIHFNLSHSGSRVLCVLSSHPCGCDVERLGRGSAALARRFFTAAEAAALEEAQSAGGNEAFQILFTRIWTRKESFLKASGDGLSRPMNTFSVLAPPPSVRFLEADPEPSYTSCVCLLPPPAEKGPDDGCIWPLPEWIPVSLEKIVSGF